MNPFEIRNEIRISAAGLRRLRQGHLWVYSGDIVQDLDGSGSPLVRVLDTARNTVGYAFYSPASQIKLRLLSRDPDPPTPELLRDRIRAAIGRRQIQENTRAAHRLVFGEADLLPSIIVDRYADYLVLQTLSRGADALKHCIADILKESVQPTGILERNDVKARRLEGLEETRGVLYGTAPDRVEIEEGGVVFLVDLLQGQKTGFFLDQSENRIAARKHVAGRALDCFTNTGAFALHFAARCQSVLGIETSRDSLDLAEKNAARNGIGNVVFREGNVFDALKEMDRSGEQFDAVCLDPPAFAKNRESRAAAKGGYKEINLRAMKLLSSEGILVTSSCSYHINEAAFFSLVCEAAHDAHRYLQILERRSQAQDHPVLASMPETHYLKCLILRVL